MSIKPNQRKVYNRVPSLAVGEDCKVLGRVFCFGPLGDIELRIRYWGLLQEGSYLLSCFKLKIDLL